MVKTVIIKPKEPSDCFVESLLVMTGLFTALSLLISATAQATPVYRWQDKDGKMHYSSSAPSSDAKPANLPEIGRGDVKLTELKLESCVSHGGINCQAGADADGSVICVDGFKEAAARYRFSCNSPKLEISNISGISANSEFSVTVRNANSVLAVNVALTYHPEGDQVFILSGPREIEPFGLGQYSFGPNSSLPVQKKVTVAELDLTCANCPK